MAARALRSRLMAVISATGIIASPTEVSAKRITRRMRPRSKASTLEVRSAISTTVRICSRVMNMFCSILPPPTRRAAKRATREKMKMMG